MKYLSMRRKSRFPHGANKALLTFNADNRLDCFDRLKLTSCRFLVVLCLTVTSRCRFGSVAATHPDIKYVSIEKFAEKADGKRRFWGRKQSTRDGAIWPQALALTNGSWLEPFGWHARQQGSRFCIGRYSLQQFVNSTESAYELLQMHGSTWYTI